MNNTPNLWTIAAAALLALSYGAAAQSTPLSTVSTTGKDSLETMTPPQDRWPLAISFDSSYVAGGAVSYQGAKGNSDAESFDANLKGEIPLEGGWFVPFGITSRNLLLGTVTGAPIPDEIDSLGFATGLGCRINDQWTIAGAVGPRLYRLDDVGSDDIGIAGSLRATYKASPDLMWAFGFAFEPDNVVPVLPLAGVRWDIQRDLTLNLMWPKPALIYHADEKLDLYVGGGGNFTVFRAEPDQGDKIGQPVYDNALGTYRDFHIGGGADYRLVAGLSLEVEAGYSVGREIDYKRIDESVDFNPSPYVKVGMKYKF